MTTRDLPFLHYMVRTGSGVESHFATPAEMETNASGGAFVAPLQSDGTLFEAYNFHFSIYLGNGSFVEQGANKAIFNGVAAGVQRKGRDHVLLTFEPLRTGPWFTPDCSPSLPHLLKHEGDEFYFPLFRRVPRRRPLKYSGKFVHKDFAHAFVELEPVEPNVLDDILLQHGISLIGCDPQSQYREKLPIQRQESA